MNGYLQRKRRGSLDIWYRAIDSDGNTIDFRFSLKRDYAAAKNLLRLAAAI